MFLFNRLNLLILLSIITDNSSIRILPEHNYPSTEVRTENGMVSGLRSERTSVVAYKGIPYAAPPVGALRWKAPYPARNWDGVYRADKFGPSPMQGKPVPFMVYTKEFLIPEEPISEDCLYLNVWTAAKNNREKRPVFVWIYGGGFVSGGSACDIYDGESLASKGIVFVSINYRVGVFGFFAHPELSREMPGQPTGNFGLLDQLAALKWVQKNIASFGGDPGNVTIGGQSAGSMSVNCLVASPLSKGLFHKAIAQSGSNVVANPVIRPNELRTAEEQGLKLAQALNVNSISDLRNIPAEELLKKTTGVTRPMIDGYVLPLAIPEVFMQKKNMDIPLLTGWNADEAFISSVKTKDQFQQDAQTNYGSKAAEFLKHYPANSDEEAAASQVALSRDMTFGLSNYKWADMQSRNGKSPAYVYYFTRKPPATGDYIKYGAFHTAEVPYMMDNLRFFNRPLEKTDEELAKTMSAYWVNFIKTGNPNGNGLPKWPAFSPAEARVMILSEKPQAAKLPGKEGLDFLYTSIIGK